MYRNNILSTLSRCPYGIHRTYRLLYHIGVIGAGQMGSGIAQVASQSGHTITLMDNTEELGKKSFGVIEKSLARIISKRFENDVESGKKI